MSSRSIFPSFAIRLAVLSIFAALSPGSIHTQQTQKLSTRIDLSASTIEGPARTRATFTAQVAGTDGTRGAVPTGSVSFISGEHSIGAAFLDNEGRATYTADALPAGEQKITAVYEGDDSLQASNSAPAVVNSAASGVPGFTLTSSSGSLSVVAGNTATTVITATPENGFNQGVSLSCSGVPYVTVTCVLQPRAGDTRRTYRNRAEWDAGAQYPQHSNDCIQWR